jgi:hypothetical protein
MTRTSMAVLILVASPTLACSDPGDLAQPSESDAANTEASESDTAKTDASESDTANTDASESDALAPLPDCLGASAPLVVSGQGLPYATATVGGAPGWFLLDFATTASTIDEAAFGGQVSAIPGTTDRYADFAFFGPWGEVRLIRHDHSRVIATVPQAGIIGTDFLSLHVYALDFRPLGEHAGLAADAPGWAVYRADGAGCDDTTLARLGLRPLSTAGHYANLPPAGRPNVPTVPIRIGDATAVAQLDTGFDDDLVPGSVNVNAALFESIAEDLRGARRPDLDLALTTCVGLAEPVEAWVPSAPLEFIAPSGEVARRVDEVVLFVKRTPPAANVCGGIGTSSTPAAQVGATLLRGAGLLVIDPLTSRVWMGDAPPR